MPNRKRKKKSRLQQMKRISVQEHGRNDIIGLVSYEISYDPIRDREFDKLPSHVKDAIQLNYEKLHESPRASAS